MTSPLKIILLTSLCISTIKAEKNQTTEKPVQLGTEHIKELRDDLLNSYDKFARPVKDYKNPVEVSFNLVPSYLDVDDTNHLLHVESLLHVTWKDESLTWDVNYYGGLSKVHFDPDEIWRPDIHLYNSALEKTDPLSEIPLIVGQTGDVLWVPSMRSTTRCSLDLTNWPVDQHKCQLNLGSWAHHGNEIKLKIRGSNEKTKLKLDHYEINKQWTLVNGTQELKKTSYGDDVYYTVEVELEVKRRASTQFNFVSYGSLCVLIIILMSYILPLNFSHARIGLHCLAFIIIAIYGTILFNALPTHNGDMPKLVRYFNGQLMLCSLSFVASILFTTIYAKDEDLGESVQTVVGSKVNKIMANIPGLKNLATPGEDSSMRYHTIDEEVTPDLNFPPPSPPKKRFSKVTVSHTVNAILFFMFAFAMVVDYGVMCSLVKK